MPNATKSVTCDLLRPLKSWHYFAAFWTILSLTVSLIQRSSSVESSNWSAQTGADFGLKTKQGTSGSNCESSAALC